MFSSPPPPPPPAAAATTDSNTSLFASPSFSGFFPRLDIGLTELQLRLFHCVGVSCPTKTTPTPRPPPPPKALAKENSTRRVSLASLTPFLACWRDDNDDDDEEEVAVGRGGHETERVVRHRCNAIPRPQLKLGIGHAFRISSTPPSFPPKRNKMPDSFSIKNQKPEPPTLLFCETRNVATSLPRRNHRLCISKFVCM